MTATMTVPCAETTHKDPRDSTRTETAPESVWRPACCAQRIMTCTHHMQTKHYGWSLFASRTNPTVFDPVPWAPPAACLKRSLLCALFGINGRVCERLLTCNPHVCVAHLLRSPLDVHQRATAAMCARKTPHLCNQCQPHRNAPPDECMPTTS